MTAPVSLSTVLATSTLSSPLKSGAISSPQIRLDFVDIEPVHKAFAPMVRKQAYDLSELAIVTCLQAIEFERPVILLPIVVASRFQRGCLISHRDAPQLRPEDLPGKRVGVRSYTQTTGMWVRAHLTEDYGHATESMRWFTRDPAHVEQYRDPSFVQPLPGDGNLLELLRNGSLDAAILGNDLPKDEAFVPVIPDAAATDRHWWNQHHFVPINHMMMAGRDACRRDPAAIKEACRLLLEANALNTLPAGSPNPVVFGFGALHKPVASTIDACVEQGLLRRRLSIDEVFGPAADILRGLLA